MHRLACLALVVAAFSSGCDRERSGPTAPTLYTPPTTTAPTTPLVSAPRFDDRFWRELVYAEWDRIGNGVGGLTPASRMLEHPRHFFILTDGMPRALAIDLVNDVPRLWLQFTGEPYTGRHGMITTIPEDVPYLTVVRADIDREFFCGGAAYHPDDPETARNEIWLHLNNCDSPRSTFAHEVGHILGFFHVGEPGHVMAHDSLIDLTAKEQYHAQLAYRVGRGAEYCGEPFTPGCYP